MNIEDATDLLWQSIQHGVHDPAALRGRLSIDQAYRIQLALLDRHLAAGEELVGWKVGLTAKAIQAQVGFHEPVLGFLLARGHRQSGAHFDFASLIDPGFENELCLTVNKTLSGPDVTLAEARAAISHVAPALEIIEKRCAAPMDIPLVMADNNQQKAFVTGDDIPLADLDLGAATVDVSVNDAHQEQANGSEVHGTPVASVQWLAHKLAQFDRPLEAGSRIMSGSFTRQYGIKRGDKIQSTFEPIGLVSAEFQ